MMKRLLLTSAALILAAPAIAADLPSRAAPPPPPGALPPAASPSVTTLPAFTWTGFYVGVQGGFTWGDGSGVLSETTTAPATTTIGRSVEANGFMGGVHAGYNYQSGSIVYGIEADAEYAAVDGALSIATSTAATQVGRFGIEQDFRGSLRARLGLAYDGVLLYVTGGAAAARVDASYAAAARAAKADTLIGWTAGAGLEYDLWSNWSMRAEYRYTSLGDQDLAFAGTAVAADNTNTYRWNVEHKEHAVRAGLSYRFGAQPSASRPIFARF